MRVPCVDVVDIPLRSLGAMLLPLLAMGTLLGGMDEPYDIDDMVLAVSAAMEGDLMEDTVGEVID